jgi:hypothetical protein
MGKEISIFCIIMEKQLASAFNIFQISGRDTKTDLYYEFHREFQPAAKECNENKDDFSHGRCPV